MVLCFLSKAESVTSWAHQVFTHYTHHPKDAPSAFVTCLEWYKHASGFEHEFVVATVSYPNPAQEQRRTKQLRIERSVFSKSGGSVASGCRRVGDSGCGHPDSQRQFGPLPHSHHHHHDPLPRRLSLVAEGRLGHAVDSITPFSPTDSGAPHGDFASLAASTKDAYLLGTYRFDEGRFTLVELARIVSSIHALRPSYSLFANQCYWFASVVWYAPQRGHSRTHDKGYELTESFGLAGTYRILGMKRVVVRKADFDAIDRVSVKTC